MLPFPSAIAMKGERVNMQTEPLLNPYQPTLHRAADQESKVHLDFVPILRRWEKFRLVFNAVLIALTLGLSVVIVPHLLLSPLYWMQLCIGGLVTNLCFFTGPAIEGYGRYFQVWNLGMSVALFVIGLCFTCFLATVFVSVIGL